MADFFSVAIALLFLLAGSILAIRFRVPAIVTFLMLGVLVGALGIIAQSEVTTFVAELGSILLLFVIGTEFSIYRIIKSGMKASSLIAILEIGIALGILFFVFSHWFDVTTSLVLALAFSITSTGVSVKLLQELGLKRKFDLRLIAGISIIEDVIAVLAFTFISALAIFKTSTFSAVAISFIGGLVIFVFSYLFFHYFVDRLLDRFHIKEEDLLVLALGLLLLLVSIATSLGLSAAFGAYVAGSIVNDWKEKGMMVEKNLRNFSYVFISFFFFAIGLQVNLSLIDFRLVLALIPLVLLTKFVSVFASSFATIKSHRLAAFTSFGMLPVGELSLVIISTAVASGLLAPSFLGVTSFIVFTSIILSFVLMKNAERIILFAGKRLGLK
ncbi:MAG: cation:proton antiporter [Candidatus Micrarchaeota archaeon]|nr:cation:proton antiporter [Candidatus Micrarchaeota archaeon]